MRVVGPCYVGGLCVIVKILKDDKSVNVFAGEVCDCKMVWDEEGEVLSCPVCGLDGT